jgi:hypothetical protein
MSSTTNTTSYMELRTEPANKGFYMVFPNRVTVSIRWGEANYSDGKTTAECAAWNADTYEWVHVDGFDYNGDDILPRMQTHEVARFMYNASIIP